MPRQPAELASRFGEDPIPPLLVATLVGGLLVQLFLPPVAPTLPSAPRGAPALPRLLKAERASVSPLSAADQTAALARPLFSASRSIAEAPSTAGDTLTLLGVAVAGTRRVASLRDGSGAVGSLTPGAVFDGWTLAGVTREGATLRRGGVTRALRVGQTVGGPPAVAATPPG